MGKLIDETDLMNLLCALYDARHDLSYAIKKISELPPVEAIPKAEVKKFLEEDTKNVSNNVLAIVREDYIHKADYENRLKADMVAILDKVRNEIDKIYEREGSSFDCLNALDELKEFIDKLKAERGIEDGKHF